MDGFLAGTVWLLKAAAFVSATLFSGWCLFMFLYARPEFPGSDLLWRSSGFPGWVVWVATLAAIGGVIGGSTVAATRPLDWTAWAVVPGLWMAGSWMLLFV